MALLPRWFTTLQKYGFFLKFASLKLKIKVATKRKPARRKPVKRTAPKRRGSKAKPKESVDWTMRIMVVLAILAVISVVLYYSCGRKIHDTIIETAQKARSEYAANTAGTAGPVPQYTGMEIPVWESTSSSQVIEHTGYTVSYNGDTKIPDWVAYELTRDETRGREKRSNRFRPDPASRYRCATDADYYKSGYDKGHMAPAGDMKWSSTVMLESFYYTNIAPQAPRLNRGVWKKLEENIRLWADRDSAVVVVCGPITNGSEKTIGPNGVTVPRAYYKVITAPYVRKPRAIGFIFPNENRSGALESYAVSVDSVERVTGMDFFSQYPDSIEKKIECSTDYEAWL